MTKAKVPITTLPTFRQPRHETVLVTKNGRVRGWSVPGRSASGQPLSAPPIGLEIDRQERAFLAEGAKAERNAKFEETRARQSAKRHQAAAKLEAAVHALATEHAHLGRYLAGMIATKLGVTSSRVRQILKEKRK